MKRFAVSLLTCAFSVIMIAELSSALIVQFHSKQIQTNNEEDTLEIGIKTPVNWFFRQVDFGLFQPIIDNYLPRIFKKTYSFTLSASALKPSDFCNVRVYRREAPLPLRIPAIGPASPPTSRR